EGKKRIFHNECVRDESLQFTTAVVEPNHRNGLRISHGFHSTEYLRPKRQLRFVTNMQSPALTRALADVESVARRPSNSRGAKCLETDKRRNIIAPMKNIFI